ERFQLRAGQQPLRDLDAQHLRVVRLALPVGAAHQPERAPLVRPDLAALELPEHVGELVDVRFGREAQSRAAVDFGIVNYCHSSSPGACFRLRPETTLNIWTASDRSC